MRDKPQRRRVPAVDAVARDPAGVQVVPSVESPTCRRGRSTAPVYTSSCPRFTSPGFPTVHVVWSASMRVRHVAHINTRFW